MEPLVRFELTTYSLRMNLGPIWEKGNPVFP